MKFTYKHIVTIGDTNLYQNMYFLQFFKLQGLVREIFINQAVPNLKSYMQNGLLMITKNASNEFIKDFFVMDEIKVELYITEIKSCSVKLKFNFYNKDNILHGYGFQTIVFADNNHKLIRIPFRRELLKYYHKEN